MSTRRKQATKKAEKPTIDTTFPRIIPSGGGKFARILVPGASTLVPVGSQEYQDALAQLAVKVGSGKVNEWLRNLGWEQMSKTNQED
jgi:hypothetical protein